MSQTLSGVTNVLQLHFEKPTFCTESAAKATWASGLKILGKEWRPRACLDQGHWSVLLMEMPGKPEKKDSQQEVRGVGMTKTTSVVSSLKLSGPSSPTKEPLKESPK